jgi:hypothetical protein
VLLVACFSAPSLLSSALATSTAHACGGLRLRAENVRLCPPPRTTHGGGGGRGSLTPAESVRLSQAQPFVVAVPVMEAAAAGLVLLSILSPFISFGLSIHAKPYWATRRPGGGLRRVGAVVQHGGPPETKHLHGHAVLDGAGGDPGRGGLRRVRGHLVVGYHRHRGTSHATSTDSNFRRGEKRGDLGEHTL